jgi:hypothetical protein
LHSIPFVKIGASVDGELLVIIHHAPMADLPGATPFGDIARIARRDFSNSCREVVLGSLDAYPSRVDGGTSEYQDLGAKDRKAFHRVHRFVGVQLGGPSSDENTVEFAPYHLRAGGNLEGCDPVDRVLVPRDEPNEAFVKAFDLACSRCRGYK